jgi:hypothetical protein
MTGIKEMDMVKNKISSNNMTKNLNRNISFLEQFIHKSHASVKYKIKEIVDLYKERKLSNVTTAQNMIDKLRSVTDKTQKRTLKQFDKLVERYKNNEPLNIRMQKSKEARLLKTTAANRIQQAFRNRTVRREPYQITVLLFSDQKEGSTSKPYKGVYLIAEKQFDVLAPSPFPEDIVKVLIKNQILDGTKDSTY